MAAPVLDKAVIYLLTPLENIINPTDQLAGRKVNADEPEDAAELRENQGRAE